MNISPDQEKLLYSEAGNPHEYVDQKFSFDFEVKLTENVRKGMSDSLHRMGWDGGKLPAFRVSD